MCNTSDWVRVLNDERSGAYRWLSSPPTLAAVVAALVLIGIGAWVGVRTFTPTGALAGASDQPPVTVTGAKGLPTSHYDDYDLVVH
jgi:hypothetical protein